MGYGRVGNDLSGKTRRGPGFFLLLTLHLYSNRSTTTHLHTIFGAIWLVLLELMTLGGLTTRILRFFCGPRRKRPQTTTKEILSFAQNGAPGRRWVLGIKHHVLRLKKWAPRRIWILDDTAFPQNHTGKVLRRELQARFTAELG